MDFYSIQMDMYMEQLMVGQAVMAQFYMFQTHFIKLFLEEVG
jgi:chloramphenicol 3-O-phosphotransferase